MEENKAKRLDLSKLKALELPHEDVEVEIAGGKQLVTVHALGGRGQLALDGLPATANHEQLVQTALIYGADMDVFVAPYLIENAREAAVKIANAVYELTNRYKKAIEEETEEAKKKSLPADSASATVTQG